MSGGEKPERKLLKRPDLLPVDLVVERPDQSEWQGLIGPFLPAAGPSVVAPRWVCEHLRHPAAMQIDDDSLRAVGIDEKARLWADMSTPPRYSDGDVVLLLRLDIDDPRVFARQAAEVDGQFVFRTAPDNGRALAASQVIVVARVAFVEPTKVWLPPNDRPQSEQSG